MIVSTGASTIDEVVRTAGWLAAARDRVAMLQCVSCYPAPDAALGGVEAIAHATGLPTGYSDHTEAVETGALAVKAGACILERHITDDRRRQGPDHAASLDAQQFARYVELCRAAHRATDQSSGQCFPPPLPAGEVAESSRPEGVLRPAMGHSPKQAPVRRTPSDLRFARPPPPVDRGRGRLGPSRIASRAPETAP